MAAECSLPGSALVASPQPCKPSKARAQATDQNRAIGVPADLPDAGQTNRELPCEFVTILRHFDVRAEWSNGCARAGRVNAPAAIQRRILTS
jgi:hypothetical protein